MALRLDMDALNANHWTALENIETFELDPRDRPYPADTNALVKLIEYAEVGLIAVLCGWPAEPGDEDAGAGAPAPLTPRS